MKRSMFAAIVILGLFVQPTLQSSDQIQAASGGERITVSSQPAPTQQRLGDAEMAATVGGNSSGCTEYVDVGGDRHVTCCLDLWIFEVCVGVNLSALDRAMDSIF